MTLKGKNPWTERQLNYLKNNYANYKNSQLQVVLGRSLTTIQKKAAELGLTKEKKEEEVV